MESVLVLISTYNGRQYLREQLDSILLQKGVHVKLLIRDDGSKDSTIDIIKEYSTGYPNQIVFEQGENIGYALSFTKLLEVANGKYKDCQFFAFSDQDDVWEDEKLYSAIKLIKEESFLIPVTYCSNAKLVDGNLKFIKMCWNNNKVKLTKECSLVQNFAIGCTMVFNRKAVEVYVSHQPDSIRIHDFLMYQLCVFLGKVIYDEKSYILYRQHTNNQIGQPSFCGRWKKRLQGHYKEHRLELQNYWFLEAYKDLLSIEDIGIISQIAFYKKNWFLRLALIFNKKIRYTSMERNIFFVMKIICGLG